MPIVGGLDIHRKQLTFDYLDTATGEVKRGQIAPADRVHLRSWLVRFAGRDDVAFALEGCTGWRYVAEELGGAGVAAHVAEPADTAFARGRKRHAKTGKTDSRHLRELLAEGRLPECWIPPSHILECRALLETYHDLRAEHTAWVQRIHAVFFHQGAPALGEAALRTDDDLGALRAAAACHLSPAGQLQVATALGMLAALEARLDVGRRRPVLLLPRRSGSPGWTSPSTPPIPSARPGGCPGRARRSCAGRCMRPARPTPAPRPPTTATTPPSRTARTASAPPCPRPARSSGRPATSWPSSATTRSPPPEPGPPWWPSWRGRPGRRAGAELTRWGITVASSRQSAVSRYRSCRAGPGGRPV